MATRSSGRLKKALRRGRNTAGVATLEVGFFDTARYPDGTPVTNVAAYNEFGTRKADGRVHTPTRPFFRNALPELERNMRSTLKSAVDPITLSVSPQLADVVGLQSAAIVQDSIVQLRTPPNAPSTIEAKGSSNPLIDSGFMRLSTTYRVTK